MRTMKRNKTLLKLMSMVLTALLVFGFMAPSNAMAAKTKKISPKGFYWDYSVKTANSKSVKIEGEKNYKVVLKGQNQRPNHEGEYNGLVRFQLPKYGTYKFTFSNLKGSAQYVGYQLYKKYNYGIGTAIFLYDQRPTLCTQDYYNKTAQGVAEGKYSKSELEDLKVGTATAKAILECKKIHYIYFMTDGTAAFNFKIKRIK